MKQHTLLAVFLLSGLAAPGQVQIDSVLRERTMVLLDSFVQLSNKYKHDEALVICDQVLELAEQNKDSIVIASCLSNKGLIYLRKGDPAKGTYYANQGLELLRRAKKGKLLSKTLLILAPAYKEQAIYDKAMSCVLEAIPYLERSGDKKNLSSAYNTAGNIYKEQKDYHKALAYHFLALQLRRETGHFEAVSGSLNNIGLVYKELGKDDSALFYFQASLDMKQVKSKPEQKANTLSNIADIYARKGDAKLSEQYYTASQKLRQELGHKSGIAQSLYEFGTLNMDMQRRKAAKRYLLQGVEKAREGNLQDVLLNCYGKLRDIYKLEGEYGQALQYSEQYFKLNEEIRGEEKQRSLLQMEAKYEAEKKERVIHDLELENQKKEVFVRNVKLENELRNRDIGTRNIWITCLVVIILLLVVLFWERYRFGKKLDMSIRELHHRVMNNFQLLLSLTKLQLAGLRDEEARKAMTSGSSRISAMVLIHKALYLNKDVTRVNIASYIRDLIDNLVAVYKLRKDAVHIACNVDHQINFRVDKAVAVGLLVNELVTNAFKYAFGEENDQPSLEIALQKHTVSGYKLVIRDNGPGKSGDLKKTLGMKLAESQVTQLKGSMQVMEGPGLGYEILFK